MSELGRITLYIIFCTVFMIDQSWICFTAPLNDQSWICMSVLGGVGGVRVLGGCWVVGADIMIKTFYRNRPLYRNPYY